jgi:hypothetical protein
MIFINIIVATYSIKGNFIKYGQNIKITNVALKRVLVKYLFTFV